MSYNSVDEYISSFPEDVRQKLSEIRRLIKMTAPQAQEKMSYGIPTYFLSENLVHFAGYKKHIGFYPTPEGIEAFKDRLSVYKTSKGTVQFPIDGDIPLGLIEEIVKHRVNAAKGND